MEKNHKRIREIFNTIQPVLASHFTIIMKKNIQISFLSIVIRWFQNSPEGYFISCPRDLNVDRYLCETCLLNQNNALYTLQPGIFRKHNYEELYHDIYHHYFRFFCLSWISIYRLFFDIKNFHKKKAKPLSLYQLSEMNLSTKDLQIWKSMYN